MSRLTAVGSSLPSLLLLATLARADVSPLGIDGLPVPAQGAISAVLGRDDAAYRASSAPFGLTARNPRHGLRIDYAQEGVTVGTGAARVGLRLASLGRGASARPVEPVAPTARANRVEYAHAAGVTAWHANGPAGLQQGFTVPSRPAGDAGAPLRLTVAFSGDLTARLEDGSLVLAADGQPVLRSRGLTAVDARGRTLPARLALAGQAVGIEVEDQDAAFPLTIVSFLETAKLTSSVGAPGSLFGWSVAIDGDTIVVGARTDDLGQNVDQGSAYVFVKGEGGWMNTVESARLVASDGAANDQFGVSVGVSGDTVVVGSWFDDNIGLGGKGSAYVFTRPDGGWSGTLHQTARLTASDRQHGDTFGASVAIDGDTIVAGAPFDDFGDLWSAQGSVYVFVRPGGSWINMTEGAKLSASDKGTYDRLGNAVAISGDTVVAGAYLDTVGANTYQGSAYVFVRGGPGWFGHQNETAKLTASNGVAGDTFGYSVAVDGDTVVAGAIMRNGAKGAAYVFVEPDTGWASTSAFTAELSYFAGAQVDRFGESVAVSGDTIVVGARYGAGPNHADQGSAHVFVKQPGFGWSTSAHPHLTLAAADGSASDQFGSAVGISGKTVVVGAWGDQFGAGAFQGSAYVFDRQTTEEGLTAPVEVASLVQRAR
jgi:hypothetical protein